MRGWLGYAFTILLTSILACVGYWMWQPSDQESSLLQFLPVPVTFALPKNKQVATLDTWTAPLAIQDTHDFFGPSISAASAVVYDLTTQRVIFAKAASIRHPMASITKIMTAIIALEHPRKDDTYLVRDEALVGEDSMGLSAGESLTLSDLLYGLMLHSGNDAAEVLADNFPGGRNAFTRAMNDKVATLGLKNTHFTNPTGLEGDGNQYTTIKDLLVITEYALSHFPLFRDVVATFDYTIPATDTHKAFYLENETNLISSYPGVKGVKTGFTPEAGLCLVTYLDYGGHHMIGIVLNSNDRRDDMKDLLDYALKKVGVTPPHHG